MTNGSQVPPPFSPQSASLGAPPPPFSSLGQAQFRCPYCQSSLPPLRKSEVSNAGWVLFWVLFLFTCALLCWIGLLIRNEFHVCASCGMKLG